MRYQKGDAVIIIEGTKQNSSTLGRCGIVLEANPISRTCKVGYLDMEGRRHRTTYRQSWLLPLTLENWRDWRHRNLDLLEMLKGDRNGKKKELGAGAQKVAATKR